VRLKEESKLSLHQESGATGATESQTSKGQGIISTRPEWGREGPGPTPYKGGGKRKAKWKA